MLAAVASGDLTPQQGRAVAGTIADWAAARRIESAFLSADEVAALAAEIANIVRPHLTGPALDLVLKEIARQVGGATDEP